MPSGNMTVMNKIAVIIVIGVLSLAGLILFGYKEFVPEEKPEDETVTYKIINEWKLPGELDEVSGIDWIGNNKLACIQDEDGIIYIFNLEIAEVEQRIEFAGPGDYEDLRIVGEDAYVLRSDGEIFVVEDYLSGKPTIKNNRIFLVEKQNLESLAWDKNNDRLLLAIKDGEPEDDRYKGVYEFSLANKKVKKAPVYRLNMNDWLLRDSKTKLRKKLSPSGLALHPRNKNFYILDGRAPQLIIADNSMNIKKHYALDKDDFKQAEGLTFSEDGRLFISNEGKGGKAKILEIILN